MLPPSALLSPSVLVGDRLFAIHQTIGNGVTAKRYWTPNYATSALWPLVIAVPGRRVTPQGVGAEAQQMTRLWNAICIVGTMEGGIPSESAQRSSETLIDILTDTYDALPRLELNDDPLGVVVRARCMEDPGVGPYPQDSAIAALIFPLQVTTRRSLPYQSRS